MSLRFPSDAVCSMRAYGREKLVKTFGDKLGVVKDFVSESDAVVFGGSGMSIKFLYCAPEFVIIGSMVEGLDVLPPFTSFCVTYYFLDLIVKVSKFE